VHFGSLCYLNRLWLTPSGYNMEESSTISCRSWLSSCTPSSFFSTRVLFAICSTNAFRAGMSSIFFVFTASSILSSTRIKSTRNCNCKSTIRSKHGFFRVSTKILIISFSSGRGHARGCHFSPPLGEFSENLATLLLHSLTVKAVWFYLRVEAILG
jgi:hypothetical protein